MNNKIRCYTLFDITQTNILSRHKPSVDDDVTEWAKKRNSQCNFDTILQVISLRSQPEVLTEPQKLQIKLNEFENFGFLFEPEEQTCSCWYFDFLVYHTDVFRNGIIEFGALYDDCDQVPMILCGTEYNKLPAFLDTSDELRNIYFEEHND